MYVMHGQSNLTLGCVAKHCRLKDDISHPLSRNTLLNSGYVLPYYDVNDAEKYYSLSRIIMLLVVSSTKLVSGKSSSILNVCAASR